MKRELAQFLNGMPNKSQFIRAAILAHLNSACPLCGGRGLLPRGVVDHFAAVLRELARRASRVIQPRSSGNGGSRIDETRAPEPSLAGATGDHVRKGVVAGRDYHDLQ